MTVVGSCGLLLLGLVILGVGAELFLRGAVGIARRLGVSPMLIGLTLVGFGTSAPELAVNLSAAYSGSTDLALGNVLGSNISNIGLILGLAALVMPLIVQMQLLKREVPILIVVTLLLFGLCLDGELGHWDGAILLALFLVVMVRMFMLARAEPAAVKEELAEHAKETAPPRPLWIGIVLILVGLGGLVGGAELMVRSAIDLAKLAGLSEMLIGLTIVAIGTSLPELASSLLAAWRGESDIAVGNVVGSNLFNILLILGATAAARPIAVTDATLRMEFPVTLGFTLLLVPVLWRRYKVTRGEGLFLLCAYLGFLAWQVLLAVG